jgi:ZIP Zinc transporter
MRTMSSSPNEPLTTSRLLEDSDPCGLVEISAYDQSLQIASIFILLVASAVGVALPLLPKYSKTLSVNPYLIVLGKCAGAGVMLACALVHMILPSNEALTSECVPSFFNSSYPAFSFFFALLAALSSHLIEFLVESFISGKEGLGGPVDVGSHPKAGAEEINVDYPLPVHEQEGDVSKSDDGNLTKVKDDDVLYAKLAEAKQLSETLLVEFSLSVHSVLVGLALGVSDGSTLVALLIALVFHPPAPRGHRTRLPPGGRQLGQVQRTHLRIYLLNLGANRNHHRDQPVYDSEHERGGLLARVGDPRRYRRRAAALQRLRASAHGLSSRPEEALPRGPSYREDLWHVCLAVDHRACHVAHWGVGVMNLQLIVGQATAVAEERPHF